MPGAQVFFAVAGKLWHCYHIMTALIILHLIFIGLWGGCVAVEMVLEFSAKKDQTLLTPVARLHDTIDKFVELPLVLGVLLTGAMQVFFIQLTPFHFVKIAAGLGAVSANLLCFVPVFKRQKLAHEKASLSAILQCSDRIFLAFYVGFSFGLIALFFGLRFRGVL